MSARSPAVALGMLRGTPKQSGTKLSEFFRKAKTPVWKGRKPFCLP